jgi:hypothetical protein
MDFPLIESLDTALAARNVQREAYVRLGGAERVAIQFRLTSLVRDTAMAGILSRHPEYSDAQAQMALRRLWLGDELVQKAWPDRELVDP